MFMYIIPWFHPVPGARCGQPTQKRLYKHILLSMSVLDFIMYCKCVNPYEIMQVWTTNTKVCAPPAYVLLFTLCWIWFNAVPSEFLTLLRSPPYLRDRCFVVQKLLLQFSTNLHQTWKGISWWYQEGGGGVDLKWLVPTPLDPIRRNGLT